MLLVVDYLDMDDQGDLGDCEDHGAVGIWKVSVACFPFGDFGSGI